MTNKGVEASIYNLCAEILLGKAKEEDIKTVVQLAKEHNLLSLVATEFGSIGRILAKE